MGAARVTVETTQLQAGLEALERAVERKRAEAISPAKLEAERLYGRATELESWLGELEVGLADELDELDRARRELAEPRVVRARRH
jgi:hypothetical protein